MTRILLLSDTHGYMDAAIGRLAENCDEIWHGGDFGPLTVAEQLQQWKTVRGVYGNIDGQPIRDLFPETLLFSCEQVTVAMKHIGGYPGRYAPGVKNWLQQTEANLFISGHSHILKAQFDPDLNCLHLNPGAAGKQGWHKVRTLMRFTIREAKIENLEVVELT